MKVYKNTLMHIALEQLRLPTLDEMLSGPSAFIFAGDDVAASAKAVKDFAKDNDILEIKGGLMEGAAFRRQRSRLSLRCLPARSSSLRSPALSPASLVVSLLPSTACRAVLAPGRQAVADQKSAA